MPQLTLDDVTTITFPPYTTSLEVLWWTVQAITLPGGAISSSIGSIRTIKSTTISIPPLTTSVLDMWHWPVTQTDISSTTYMVMSSILPPLFMITNSVPAGAVAPPQNTGSGHQAGQPEAPHNIGEGGHLFVVVTSLLQTAVNLLKGAVNLLEAAVN
ncbi:hypothetical protein H109_06451 [Trichophyton interdigitale MR816]|uniref:Uncharacterized protein n=1 Tax=Trichophyton interdigitale (strain MR816) TaxID=1215338 RepID=A0A059J2B8_TRIIM|nr:hypothetical protein H109_06451 [Trichophyton interdigitale MR816]